MVPQPALDRHQYLGRDKIAYVPIPCEFDDAASTAPFYFQIIAN